MKRFLRITGLLLLAAAPCTYAQIDITQSATDFTENTIGDNLSSVFISGGFKVFAFGGTGTGAD